MLWADSYRDARAALRAHRPQLVITRPKLTDGDALRVLAELGPELRANVLVLLKKPEWEVRARFLEAGAIDVLDHHDGERLLGEVSRLTGIQFARHRRVRFESPGEAKIVGASKSYPVKSRDLSITGIGLVGVTAQPEGTLVKLTLLVDGRPGTFWGRVTRSWTEESDHLIGLRFIAMSEEERLALAAFIEPKESFSPPALEVMSTLFDDVKVEDEAAIALRTADILGRGPPTVPPPGRDSVPDSPASTLAQPMARLTAEARSAKAGGDRVIIHDRARAALAELETIGTDLGEEGLAELAEVRAALLREYMSQD